MYRYISACTLFLLIFNSLQCAASGLVPRNIRELIPSEVYYSLPRMVLHFSYEIAGDPEAKATIYCGEEVVYQGRLIYGNSSLTEDSPVYGYAVVYADPTFTLPKGKKYRLHIPEGCIWRVDKPERSLDEINCEFEVPGHLKAYFRDWEYRQYLGYTSFMVPSEVEVLPGAEFRFYREDEYVRSYGCSATADWDTGFVSMLNAEGGYWEFSDDIPLEQGVKYKLVFPANTLRTKHRDDIFNEEVTINFIGGLPPTDSSAPTVADGRNEAEWFTIHGTPVSSPDSPGLYIRRQSDGTTTKHIIR